LNSNKATYNELFGCSGISFGSVWWFVFFEFLTPFTLQDCNFLLSNPFLTIVNVSDVPRGGVQVLFGHKKKQSPALGSALPRALKCSVTGRSTLKTSKALCKEIPG